MSGIENLPLNQVSLYGTIRGFQRLLDEKRAQYEQLLDSGQISPAYAKASVENQRAMMEMLKVLMSAFVAGDELLEALWQKNLHELEVDQFLADIGIDAPGS